MVLELNPEAYQLWLQHVFVFQTKNIQSNLEGRILNPYISHYKESIYTRSSASDFSENTPLTSNDVLTLSDQ